MIVVGVDQSRRHSGVSIFHYKNIEEYKVYSFTSNTDTNDFSKVNEVLFCYNNFVSQFERVVKSFGIWEEFLADEEKYLGIEAPLESVAYAGKKFSKYRGTNVTSNNTLAQLFILILTFFLKKGFKCLQFHPNYTRGFFGGNRNTGKKASLDKGKEWKELLGDKWIPYNSRSPINNHVSESMLFVYLSVMLVDVNHSCIPKDDFYSLLKWARAWMNAVDSWYINFIPENFN